MFSDHLLRYAYSALATLPFLVLTYPVSHVFAAFRVQNKVAVQKGALYMVFYHLTPVRFHRYSSFNLCPPVQPQEGVCCSERRRNLSSQYRSTSRSLDSAFRFATELERSARDDKFGIRRVPPKE